MRERPPAALRASQGSAGVIPDGGTGRQRGTIGGMTENPTSGLGDDLRELRRSRDDRVIAGVLGGVARRLSIDPVVLRIITAVLAVFGGVGVVLYALGWLLIPDEDADSSIAEQSLGRRGRSPQPGTIALAAALIIAVLFAAGGMFGSGVGPLLLVLAIVGAVMLLRRRDDEGTPPLAADPAAYPPYGPAADPLTGDPLAADPLTGEQPGAYSGWSADPTEAQTGWPAAAAGAGTEEPGSGAPSAPFPGAEPGYPAAATAGTGWPEGPDWEPPTAHSTGAYPTPARPEPRPRSLLGPLTFSAVAVAMGVLAVNDATWASIPISAYIATALAIVGAGLLVGTWVGRSRGLIGLGILLTLALPPAVFVADELNLNHDHTTVTVTSLSQLPDGPQVHGSGQVTYDLSGLELTDENEVVLEISQSLGELLIIVPAEADVTVSASAGLGQIEAFDGMSAGVRPTRTATDLGPDGAGGGIVTLDLDVAMGRIEVTR